MSWGECCEVFRRDFVENERLLTEARDMLGVGYLRRVSSHLPTTAEKAAVDGDLLGLLAEFHQHLWEKAHSVAWKDVASVHCDLFGLASALAVSLQREAVVTLLHCNSSGVALDEQGRRLGRLLQQGDLGLLMGGAKYLPLLSRLVDLLHALKRSSSTADTRPGLDAGLGEGALPRPRPPGTLREALRRPVPRIPQPPVQVFFESHFLRDSPLVITEMATDWKALQRWSGLEYLESLLGDRLVPVELGDSYLSQNYSSSLMTGNEFIRTCLIGRSKKGYLAQHALFDQIPQLRGDFAAPDFCCLLKEDDEEEDNVVCNAWLGPSCTVSPLHYDCFHNILAQVVGYKYVRLYHPSYSHVLRPMGGKMKNNSRIDLLTDIVEDSPLASIPYLEAILCPGDMLYLPRHYWHFIMAVDFATAEDFLQNLYKTQNIGNNIKQVETVHSFSINFWWGKRLERD